MERLNISPTRRIQGLGAKQLPALLVEFRGPTLIERGKLIVLSGPGGVGKSFVTSVILAFLRAVFSDTFSKAVAITAPTGIAATHIGGTTLHSAMGVGVPLVHEDFASRMGGGASGGKGKSLATQLQVLLIDEVSMLSAEFLDLLDEQVIASW